MRDILEFYRRRPVLGAVLVTVAFALSVAIALVARTDNVVLPVVFTAIIGVLVGVAVGAAQRGDVDE